MTVLPASAKVESKLATWAGPAVLGLCLILGVTFIWWFFYGSLPRERTIVLDPSEVRRPSGRWVMQPVRMFREGEWFVRGWTASMFVHKQGEDFRFAWNLNPPAEQQQVAMARAAALRDAKRARLLGLSDDQIARLKRMELSGSAPLSDEDREKIVPIWAAYLSAANSEKSEAAKKMQAAVDDIGKTSQPAARAEMGKRLKEMEKILTPQVIAKLTRPAAAPAPATRPAAHRAA
jgi:hypothetical protein